MQLALPSASNALKAVGAVVAAAVAFKVFKAAKLASAKAALKALEPGIVHIFMFPRWSKTANISTPCLKLETFLRLAKIPYIAHLSMDAGPLSPTERLPFISYNGELVADSEFIIQYLTQKFNVKLDTVLSPEQAAQGLAIRRQTETFLSWGQYRQAWVDHPKVIANIFITEMGAPAFLVNNFILPQYRKSIIHMLNTTGHGDLTDAQYTSELVRDLKALELVLSKKPFLLADTATSYDCPVYAYLANFIVLAEKMEKEPCRLVRSSEVFKAYVARINALAFPDFAAIADGKAKIQTFKQ